MKRWISVILFICLIVTLTGCEAVTGKGGVIYYEETTPPVNVDPLLAASQSERIAVHQLFEPLFRIGENGNVIPAAAQSVTPSPDGLTYTIALRDDLVWSDEQPITARDFAFALRRVLLPETKAQCAQQFLCIAGAPQVLAGTASADTLGITTPDDTTLVLQLTAPDPNLTAALSGPGGMPCRQDFFEACGGRYGMGKKYVIASGGYTVTRWITAEKEELLRLSKNKNYWNKDAMIPDGIVMSFADTENRLFRMKKNDVDCGALPQTMVEEATRQEMETLSYGQDVYGLVLNTAPQKPTGNLALRKALIGAVDRQTVASYLPAYCVSTDSVMLTRQYDGAVAYSSLGYHTDFAATAQQNFRSALATLGADAVKNLTLCYTEQEGIRSAIDSMVQCWQKQFGVYVTVRAMSNYELSSAVASGNFDLAVCPMNNPQMNSRQVLTQFGKEADSPYQALGGEEYDALLSGTGSLSARQQAEQWLFQNGVVLPLYEARAYYVYDTKLSGLSVDPVTRVVDFTKTLKF